MAWHTNPNRWISLADKHLTEKKNCVKMLGALLKRRKEGAAAGQARLASSTKPPPPAQQ